MTPPDNLPDRVGRGRGQKENQAHRIWRTVVHMLRFGDDPVHYQRPKVKSEHKSEVDTLVEKFRRPDSK